MRQALATICRAVLRALEPRNPPPPPTETELSENVQHVCYEVAAMERAAEVLQRGGRFRFEAFLIHARLLREFLWRKSSDSGPGAENSLLAEHYFEDPLEWRSTRGGLPPALKKTKQRIDRQIAHLARDRHREFMDLEKEVQQIHDEIRSQWDQFQGSLPTRWAASFHDTLEEKRQLLERNHN